MIICSFIICPTYVYAECGPSKGLVSGMTLTSTYVAPTGTVSDKPGMIDDEDEVVQSQVESSDFVTIGNNLILSKKYSEAITAYDQALAVNPEDPDAWNGKMSALLYLVKYEDVLDLFNEAHDIIPKDFGIWVNKGRAEYYLQRWDDAQKSAEKSLNLKYNNLDALILKADSLAIRGEKDALTVTDLIINADPDNPDIWFARGLALGQKDPEAVDAYLKDIEFHPERSCSYFYLVKIYIDNHKTEDALSILRNMVNNNPEYDSYVHSDLNTLLKYLTKNSPDIDLKKTEPLWEWYFSHSDNQEKETFRIERWENLYSALLPYSENENGEYDAIADLYNSLVRLEQPSTNDEWFEVYYGYTSIGEKYGKELESIENLIEIYPQEQLLWYFKSDYFTEKSMYDEAIESLERYEELGGPGTAELIEELKKMKKNNSTPSDSIVIAGSIPKPVNDDSSSTYSFISGKDYSKAMHSAYNDGDVKKAIEIIEDGLKKFPDNSDLWSDYGALLNNLERYDEAIEATDKAISLGKTNAHAWYVKGYALEKLEKYLDAEIYYEKSLELKPDNKDYIEALDRVRKLI